MRDLFKYIISCLGLGNLARILRRFLYLIFDFLGTTVFFILRVFRLFPQINKFNEEFVKKILIIRLDRIGDLILSTPAIRAVRESFPKADIHLLIREYTRDLVLNNPNIDRLLIYEKDKISREYDLAIALHPGYRQNYLTFISGAKFRVGYTGWGGSFFLTHKIKDDRVTRVRHEVISALEVVKIIGCDTKDKRLEVSVTDEGEKFACDFFKQNKLDPNDLIVIIHPGARQYYIRWEKEGFAKVADRLIKEKEVKVILIGTDEEKTLVEEVGSLMKGTPLFVIGVRLTALVSLIKRCKLFIGNSTGPMHIAVALDVPTVVIFGSQHPLDSYKAWGPWGEGHIVVRKDLNCPDCHPTDCRSFDCMKLISVDQVYEAAINLIREHG